VLGYLQQCEELKLSTEALRLQAEELKKFVEQQREFAEVTRLQVEGEREALAYERRQREEEERPSFVVVGVGGSFRGDGYCNYGFVISNKSAHGQWRVSQTPALSIALPLRFFKQMGLPSLAPR
jgi:hypothetical protein